KNVPAERLMCLNLGMLEVISVFVRRSNAGLLTSSELNQALTDFRTEVMDAVPFAKVVLTGPTVLAAIPLIQTYSVNSTDALVLRSALDAGVTLRAAGNDLVLVSSDKRLVKAAQAEGLRTFDPETQTQADLDALLGP